MKIKLHVLIGFSLFIELTAAPAGWPALMEPWYMSRGNANMAIGNYKAAIEAFEKVVEMNPDNREAMRSLGLAYERQGLTDKAIEQFDRYLAKYDDDPEIAFKQAQALQWFRYAYREKDKLRYYRMGLKRKDDPNMRLKYAAHLARQKSTSQEAIAQYEKVLAKEPRNVEAYRGLAKAYAWLGDNDRALYYTNLAHQYAGREPSDMTALRRDMMKGCEPTTEGRLGVILHPEKPFELYGFRLGSSGTMDLTPFSTATVEAGIEHFRDSSQNSTGAYISIGTQVRFNPANRFEGMLEYHDVVRADGLAYKFEFAHDGSSFSIRPGVKRKFRYDSFTALAESRLGGRLLGAARSTLLYTDLRTEAGRIRFDITPFVGWVSAESLGKNEQVGITTKAAITIRHDQVWDVSAEYLFYLTHYGEDQSGFQPSTLEPLPGGYFSPQVFLNQIPRLAVTYATEDKSEIYMAAGPTVQYIDETQRPAVFRIGADAHAAYTTQLPKRKRYWHTNFKEMTEIAPEIFLEAGLRGSADGKAVHAFYSACARTRSSTLSPHPLP